MEPHRRGSNTSDPPFGRGRPSRVRGHTSPYTQRATTKPRIAVISNLSLTARALSLALTLLRALDAACATRAGASRPHGPSSHTLRTH